MKYTPSKYVASISKLKKQIADIQTTISTIDSMRFTDAAKPFKQETRDSVENLRELVGVAYSYALTLYVNAYYDYEILKKQALDKRRERTK